MIYVIACCAFTSTQAIPAYPRRVKIATGNDSFYLYLRGDENCKYALTEDGYTALQDSCGWYYACTNQVGEVIKSTYKVCSEEKKSNAINTFLSSQAKGIYPTMHSKDNIIEMPTSESKNTQLENPVVGDRRILIILMEYRDVKFKKTQEDFYRLFNEKGYSDDGAYGSVYDYYNKVSYEQLRLACDILGPYTASKDMSYYGGNYGRTNQDMNPKALFNEAIQFALQDAKLSDYDNDGDGFVDNVHIIFAGYGEEAGASANSIWSHEMTFKAENVGDVMIDHYSCSPELRGNNGNRISHIGPPCHEIGHALGAMDYYDVDYQAGGYYEGTGDWDIMASGSWNDEGARPADFNPYVKAYNFGWVDVQTLEQDTLNFIPPSTQTNSIYRIDTPVNGDYFLLDNRQSRGITSAEPGKGLLIFHIGPQMAQKEKTNTINSTYPQQCYIVCASSKDARPRASASSYGDISSSGSPYPGTMNKTSFTNSTIPAALCFNGIDAQVSLTNITEFDGGYISLLYEKKEASGDNPPVIPPDEHDDDEVNGDIVWSEDFEIVSRFRHLDWIVENVKGKGNWLIKSYSSTPTAKDPSIISGKRYMSMEAEQSGTIMGKTSKYSCRLISNGINLSEGEYILTGYYGGYASQKISNDTLSIEILTANSNIIIASTSLHITRPMEWYSFSIPINCIGREEIIIAFTGVADEKSKLFLDNLKLSKPIEDGVKSVLSGEDVTASVYRIDGIFLGAYCNVKSKLQRGIYIIRQGKYVRKFYVK